MEAAKEVAPASETVEVGAEAPAADAQSSEEAPGDVTGDGGADTAAGQEPPEGDTGSPESSDAPPLDPTLAPGQPEESGGGGEKPTEAPAKQEGAGESLEQGGGADGELPASEEGEREGQALPAKTEVPAPATAKQAAPDSSGGEGQADAPGAEQGDPEDDLPPVVEVKIASDTKLGVEMKQLGAALHRSQPWKTRAVQTSGQSSPTRLDIESRCQRTFDDGQVGSTPMLPPNNCYLFVARSGLGRKSVVTYNA